MIFNEGDIIVNYRYKIVYKFDPKNENHIKSILSCRIASFQESEKYYEILSRVGETRVVSKEKTYRDSNRRKKLAKFGTTTVEFPEMGKRFGWEDRDEIEIRFKVTSNTLLFIQRKASEFGSSSYTTVINHLLSIAAEETRWTGRKVEEATKELKQKRVMQEFYALEMKMKAEIQKTIQKIGGIEL